MSTELSTRTKQRISVVFAPELQQLASSLLVEHCGTNLPLLKALDPVALERYRFAALKLSDGQIDKLKQAVLLAQTDWRDLLVAAGFAQDPNAHESWSPANAKS
jgi:ABC-type siderophore export system fused ATPase/permease subunit